MLKSTKYSIQQMIDVSVQEALNSLTKRCQTCGSGLLKWREYSPDGGAYYFCSKQCHKTWGKESGEIYRTTELQLINCDCKNAVTVEEIHTHKEEIRSVIENNKNTLTKHTIFPPESNACGEIVSKCPDCNKSLPIICMCGGSMWLCRKCKEEILERENNKKQKGDKK